MGENKLTEQVKEEILTNEDALLRGLFEAANYKNDKENRVRVDIKRKERILFSFHIHPLTEEEINNCREEATKYVRSSKYGGIKLPENTDKVRYRSNKIYAATVEEDRKKLWDNRNAQLKLDVISPVDMIDKVLLAGEKEKIDELIEEISGFEDASLVEVAKN